MLRGIPFLVTVSKTGFVFHAPRTAAVSWRELHGIRLTGSAGRKVRWDLSTVSAAGGWVNGNGTVDGNAYTDRLPDDHTSGAATQGQFIVDELPKVVTAVMETSTDDMSVSLPGKRGNTAQ